MLTDYQTIYQGDIFTQSQCIWHENVLLDWLRSQLISLGYNSLGGNNKTWQKSNRQAVTCLVDDITTCRTDGDLYLPALWDSNTTVITDNVVNCPTAYTVHRLPTSWFGIYSHTPREVKWQPDRRFNFSVNRLDMKRMLLFLEYWRRLPWHPDRDHMDYVNFNCWSWDGNNSDEQGLAANWQRQWNLLDDHQRETYADTYSKDFPRMPFRNHDLDHESAMHRAWINLVVETYSGDTVIALSEKIFRALVTPTPWMIYSGRYSVVYLETLGFDCMSDIMDHGYDSAIETRTVDYGDKLVDWFWKANENYTRLQTMDHHKLSTRCIQAAEHNKTHLRMLRAKWPTDFAAWWPTVVSDL